MNSQGSFMKQTIVLIVISIACLAAGVADDLKTTENSKRQSPMTNTFSELVSVRYMIDDVKAAVAFYTSYLGFTLEQRGRSGVCFDHARIQWDYSGAAKRLPVVGRCPTGRSRYLAVGIAFNCRVLDIEAEASRLRAAGVKFRRDDIVSGPGGSQIWLVDPSGNCRTFPGEMMKDIAPEERPDRIPS